MHHLIASFLFQNKTCPLPGLGTLSVVQSGAEADFANKLFDPPNPIIQFNEAETDTAGLLNYLAAQSGGDNYEVTEAVEHFCENLKKEITARSQVKLDNIGNFFADDTGTISFKPEALPAIFLQPVFAERAIHPDSEHNILVGDKETTNIVMAELLAPKSGSKDRWWIWAIVLGAIGLLALVIYFTELNGTSSFGNAIKI
jgi:CCDC81-like prokaryotic HU domain 2